MIKSKRQYNDTTKLLEKYSKLLKKSLPVDDGDLENELYVNSLKTIVGDLEIQLKEYDDLEKGNLQILSCSKLEDLPLNLIKARIASGLSQKKLADKLGISPQQVQRNETNDNQHLNAGKLQEISDALGLEIEISKIVFLKNQPSFLAPDELGEANIQETSRIIAENRSILF